MKQPNKVDFIQLREALEASWDSKTSYGAVSEIGNPALGQCYPTSRIVQFYYPDTEIVEGIVWTGEKEEKHFWNLLKVGEQTYHIDLSWQQFPQGSVVRSFKIRDREKLDDSQKTIVRVELLKNRVLEYFAEKYTK